MPDLLLGLLERPSRLLGWGLVTLLHLLMWQVFSHGLDWTKTIAMVESIQVSLLHEDAAPEAPPPLPKLAMSPAPELFVPAPEVTTTVESAVLVSITSVPSPASPQETAPMSTVSQAHVISLPVVSESEVDYLVKPEVRYPLASKRADERGIVLLSVIVNARGLVDYVSVYQTSGYRRLDETAMRAVRSMRVKPYIRNGMAMPIELRVPVEFS